MASLFVEKISRGVHRLNSADERAPSRNRSGGQAKFVGLQRFEDHDVKIGKNN